MRLNWSGVLGSDALCVVSNGNSDMQRGIQRMDLIYERSHFNIITAAGPDASFCIAKLKSENIRNKTRSISRHLSFSVQLYDMLKVQL